MPDSSSAYAVVIADLERQREDLERQRLKLDSLISELKARAGTSSTMTAPAAPIADAQSQLGEVGQPAAAQEGISLAEAAVAVMADMGEAPTSKEIVAVLESRGRQINSTDKANTLNTALNRRMKRIGDVYRPEKGKWGLTVWQTASSEPALPAARPEFFGPGIVDLS